MSLKRIIFRADASPSIGYGHLYRVFALSQSLNSEFECTIASSGVNEKLLNEFKRNNISYIDLPPVNYSTPSERESGAEVQFDLRAVLDGNEIVVTDGYWFGTNYQKEVKKMGSKLVCIDDLAEAEFVSDVVINHAPGLDKNKYKVNYDTKLCLGLDYLILRPEFFEKKSLEENTAVNKNIYVCMGGADPYGLTLKILHLLTPIITNIDRISILTTPLFIAKQVLEMEKIKSGFPHNIKIFSGIKANEICDLLDNSTHAIVTSSTVALEAIARGIRPLIGYCTENQIGLYNGTINEGYAIGLGNVLENIKPEKVLEYLNTEQTITKKFNSVNNLKKVFHELAS